MENSQFQFGKVVSPLPITSNLPLDDIDPILAQIISFFPAVIALHAGARWNIEVAKVGLPDLADHIVAQSLPYDPLPFRQDNTWKFPLFVAYPVSSGYDMISVHHYKVIRDIEILYILPPLQSSQAERLYPFLTHIERIIANRTMDGFDDNYNDGYVAWQVSGVEKIQLISCQQGKIPGLKDGLETNIFYPSLSMTIRVSERNEFVDGNFELMDGEDTTIDLVDDPTISSFVEIEQDF